MELVFEADRKPMKRTHCRLVFLEVVIQFHSRLHCLMENDLVKTIVLNRPLSYESAGSKEDKGALSILKCINLQSGG